MSRVFPYLDKAKVKGKLYTLKCHEGPDEKKSYNSTLTLTSAIGGDGWSTPRPGRFTPGEESRYPFVQEAGWAAGPENLAPPSLGSDLRIAQLLASRYADCAVILA
jgi:hypothetical protein